jgi:hypothetical protein
MHVLKYNVIITDQSLATISDEDHSGSIWANVETTPWILNLHNLIQNWPHWQYTTWADRHSPSLGCWRICG